MAELVSIAYVRPAEGKEEQTIEILAELYALLRKKNYSRDLLYRDAKDLPGGPPMSRAEEFLHRARRSGK